MYDIPVTIVSLSPFLKKARALGLSESDIEALENLVASSPDTGDLIEGTGGIRKRRITIPGRNKGKSGGGRVFTLFVNYQMPVYLITILDKADKGNLSQSEQNELAALSQAIKSAHTKVRS